MTLRKKIEKPAEEEKPAEDEEKPAEGEEKEPEEPKEEYKTFTRFIEVGNKIELAKYFDDETGEAETKEFYAIRVGGDFDDAAEEELSQYVYLVSDYTIGGLRKTLGDLVVEGDSEGSESTAESTEGAEEPAKEEPAKDAEPAKEAEPTKEEGPAKEEPAKKDEAEEKTGD